VGLFQAIRAFENPLGEFMRYYRTYGPVFTTRFLGGIEMVWLIGPEANQYILVENAKNFSWREGFLGDLIPILGDGLLTTDREVHDRARRLLNPLFFPARIRAYAERMILRARERVEELHLGQELEVFHWMRTLSLTIAGDILFGFGEAERLAPAFSSAFDEALRFYAYPLQVQYLRGPLTPWDIMQKARKRMDKILYPEIARRRKNGKLGENILDLLIGAEDNGERFTDKEIRDQAMTLLFAGHDTSTCTLTWMIMLLGMNRAVYRRLHEEIDSALGDRPPTPEELISGLPYLNQVLAETLRMYPPAWVGPRRAIEDFEIYGYRIPGGTNVAYSSWLTHHLPHVFPDPEAFDPDRFTPEEEKKLKPGAYVPFGRGQRLCIGMRFGEMEVKAVAVSLLQRYHLELLPGQDFRPHTMPTLSPRYGVRVRILPKDLAYRGALARRTIKRIPSSESSPSVPPSACPVHLSHQDSH
jgi:cytochrome P450